MFDFAQTNLQLYRQLRAMDYGTEDIARLAQAYKAGVPMFSGLYRSSGKPFIAHLVGTASILVSRKIDVEVVLAGLLHAAYMVGDMGFHPGRRQSGRKRKHISQLIGKEAEQLVSVYDTMRWTPGFIRECRSSYTGLPAVQKKVVLIELANLYEDFMDDGMRYKTSLASGMYADRDVQDDVIALSNLCHWPALATLFEQAFDGLSANRDVMPDYLGGDYSALLLPPSASRNMLSTAQGWIVRRLRRT